MASKTVEEIFQLIQKHGKTNYIGEPVTIEEHMIQCAMLAENNGNSAKVILGAFFHDIGQLVGLAGKASLMVTDGQILGTKDHEVIGANFLRQCGFGSEVSEIVLHHVDAKRYLVYKNPLYFEELSEASKQTLVHQGGPMSASEAEEFEKSPFFNLMLQIREWDEQSKEPSKQIKPLGFYQKMCLEYLGQ